jgi:tight adherence protein C
MSALNELLPFGWTADDVLVMLLAATAFILVVSLWFGLIERNPMEMRVQRVKHRRDQLKREMLAGTKRPNRRAESISMMRQVVNALKLMQNQQVDKLQFRLAQAGQRSRDAIFVFMFFKVAMPVALGGMAFVMFYIIQIGDLAPAMRMLITIGAILLGFYTPELYVSNLISKRQLELAKALPDGIDLLVICAESGLSLDSGLERVSRELGDASPELAEELQLTSVELGFLPERRQALANLNKRTNLPAIRGVVNTLMQTEKYGTPLSQSLRVLANEFRDQRMLRAEEKAARLPATLTVPMIVFILPVLFIVLVGPAIISVMDNMIS